MKSRVTVEEVLYALSEAPAVCWNFTRLNYKAGEKVIQAGCPMYWLAVWYGWDREDKSSCLFEYLDEFFVEKDIAEFITDFDRGMYRWNHFGPYEGEYTADKVVSYLMDKVNQGKYYIDRVNSLLMRVVKTPRKKESSPNSHRETILLGV